MLNAYRSDAKAKAYLDKALDLNLSLPFCGYVIANKLGDTVGAFVFNGFTGDNVELTIACQERVTIRIARFIALLAFFDLGANRLSARTRSTNQRAIRAMLSVGFKFEGVAREYFSGEDAILFGMLAKEQKLVKRK